MNPGTVFFVLAGLFVAYEFLKSPTAGKTGIGTASTTSPLGSASGVLTPVGTVANSFLSGLEAFGAELSGAPQPTQAQINASAAAGLIPANNASTDQVPTTAPLLDSSLATPSLGTNYLSGLGIGDDTDIGEPTDNVIISSDTSDFSDLDAFETDPGD